MLPNDGRTISQYVASLNMLVHDVINFLYYQLYDDPDRVIAAYWNKAKQY